MSSAAVTKFEASRRFWLSYEDSEWVEVDKVEFVRAERVAGFHNTLGQPDEPATHSFGAASVRGRTTYGDEGAMTVDPFVPVPPSAAEQAQVDDAVALLSAAADRLERQVADGKVDPLFTDLVAWLRSAAREAVEVGSNGFAVALARRIMGEEGR